MHVPPLTDACWARLAQSQLPLRTRHLPTQLMLARVQRSNQVTAVKAAELFAYFARWCDSLERELDQICER